MSESLKSRLAEAESEANSEVSGGAGGAGGVEYAAMSWEKIDIKLLVIKHTKKNSILGTTFQLPRQQCDKIYVDNKNFVRKINRVLGCFPALTAHSSYWVCCLGDLQQLLLGSPLSILGLGQVLLQVIRLLQPRANKIKG